MLYWILLLLVISFTKYQLNHQLYYQSMGSVFRTEVIDTIQMFKNINKNNNVQYDPLEHLLTLSNAISIHFTSQPDPQHLRAIQTFCKKLRKLSITCNQDEIQIFNEIHKESQIELDLKICIYYDTNEEQFEHMMSRKLPPLLRRIRNLRHLSIINYRQRVFTKNSISQVVRCASSLQQLNISGFDIQVGAIQQLSKLKQLRSLQLEGIKYLNTNVMKAIADELPELKTLSFSCCQYQQQKQEVLLKIGELKNLQQLKICVIVHPNMPSKKSQIFKKLILNTIQSLPNLQRIEISNIQYSADQLGIIRKKALKISKIKLFGCMVDDEKFQAITQSPNNISELQIPSSKTLTIQGVRCLTNNQNNLSVLNLSGCGSIGNRSLMIISEKLPTLKDLNVQFCSLDNSGMIYVSKMKQLQILDIGDNICLLLVCFKMVGNLKKMRHFKIDYDIIRFSRFPEMSSQMSRCIIKFSRLSGL